MPRPETYSYQRYLAAKKAIDDKALNPRVWDRLALSLPRGVPDNPVRVLELGAGTGSMVERVLERGLFAHADYRALDLDPDNVDEARRRIDHWAGGSGYASTRSGCNTLTLRSENRSIRVEFEAVDALDFVARERGGRFWDLLIAQAFLDLVDVPSLLPGMLSLLKPGGLLYLSLNFDGHTILEPEIDRGLDSQIEAMYHETMDRRTSRGRPSGDSRTGRHLFEYLAREGARVLEAGASDWVVFPGPGGYTEDEMYFLHYIVHTIHQALVGDAGLDQRAFDRWVEKRHAQVEAGELLYIAHQLDILAQAHGA